MLVYVIAIILFSITLPTIVTSFPVNAQEAPAGDLTEEAIVRLCSDFNIDTASCNEAIELFRYTRNGIITGTLPYYDTIVSFLKPLTQTNQEQSADNITQGFIQSYANNFTEELSQSNTDNFTTGLGELEFDQYGIQRFEDELMKAFSINNTNATINQNSTFP